MIYDSRHPKLIDGLCLLPTRKAHLMRAFKKATADLPNPFRTSDLHARVAPFLETAADGYFMGNMICEFIHRCKAGKPYQHSEN